MITGPLKPLSTDERRALSMRLWERLLARLFPVRLPRGSVYDPMVYDIHDQLRAVEKMYEFGIYTRVERNECINVIRESIGLPPIKEETYVE